MRFYRLLLRLYPASFRSEYAEELCRVFDQRRRVARGPLAVLWVWLDTLVELPVTAAQVHFDILRQDLHYAARTLRRSPGFALTAIVVMALGVGATTAAFSVTDHVLLRPLPFPEPERLVRLWENPPGYAQMELSPSNYRDWKAAATSFEGMGVYSLWARNLVGPGDPVRLNGGAISPELIPILGAQPMLGRLFRDEEDVEGAPLAMLLSYGLWQRQFGGDPGVLGAKVHLDGEPATIIGVMPRGFYFPNSEVEFWYPMRLSPGAYQDRNNNFLKVVARLKQGVTLEQARAEMTGIAARLEKEYPVENANNKARVNRIQDEISSQARVMLVALFGAALCLLLIACTNLANLLLARALARRRELAVRAALGAGRERLTRQMLTESLTLAALGGLLGVPVAMVAVPLLSYLVPDSLPIAGTPALDWRVLAFAALVTCLTGLAFGVVPALRVCRRAVADGLREGARAGGGRKERLRSALVIAEVTASIVLLVSAGLLLRALWRLQAVDPGFHAEGVLTMQTALPIPKYAAVATRKQFYEKVISEVKALPGVTEAAYISFLPMTMRGGIWPVSLTGQPAQRDGSQTASLRYVTPGFFRSMGIPLRSGRDVGDGDTQQTLPVAVVSESFVKRYWSDQDPIGRTFNFAFHERTVVGVVGNVRVRGLEQSSEPQVYLPYQQVEDGNIIYFVPKDLVVRAANPEMLIPAVRRVVHSVDSQQPVSNVRLLTDVVAEDTAPRRAQLSVIAGFATMAFLLAGIGIHGLLSYAVSQRTQEIGVRIALGAQRSTILRLVLRDGFVLTAAGVLLGVGLAYAAGRGIESLLFGVQPADPATYLAAASLAVVMALAGSLLPALRAARVDPTVAIRVE